MVERLIAELAEPQGEPVAWLVRAKSGMVRAIHLEPPNMDYYDLGETCTPLYARPDPRVAELQSKVCLLQQNDLATVMLRRRVEKLEGLLRETHAFLEDAAGSIELYKRIRAALGEG